MKKIENGERLEKGTIPTKLYEVMLLCWKEKPEDRPSFQQLSKLLKTLLQLPTSSPPSSNNPQDPKVNTPKRRNWKL